MNTLIFSISLRRFCNLKNLKRFNACNSFSTNIQNGNYFNKKKTFTLCNTHAITNFCRTKHTKKSSKDINEDDSEDEDDFDFQDEKDSKVVKTKLSSLRMDLVIKAGLGMSRNKVETNFYEGNIRVNGKKVLKKSGQVKIEDEIDYIKGFSQMNPTHLIISRVQILSVKEGDEKLSVVLRRYKTLTIENYEGPNAYKKSAES